MRLHFNHALVERLLAHTLAAPAHQLPYEGLTEHEECAKPGLFLVGDDGIYLMSNGEPQLPRGANGMTQVCYAKECDPTKMAFGDWWAVKQESFGGSDGVEFLPAADIRRALDRKPAKDIVLDVEAENITIIF